jgi:hypothetical protein
LPQKIKKGFGMKNDTATRMNHSRTLGPHHLHTGVRRAAECVGQNVPILNGSSLVPSVFNADERQTENDMEEGEGEAYAMDLGIL